MADRAAQLEAVAFEIGGCVPDVAREARERLGRVAGVGLDLALGVAVAALKAETFERVGEDGEGQCAGQLEAVERSAFAVRPDADEAFAERRFHRAVDREAGEVLQLLLLVDVAFQILPVARNRDIGLAPEVFFKADVDAVGDPRPEPCVAAATAPGRAAKIDVGAGRVCFVVGVIDAGAHVVHLGARELAAEPEAGNEVPLAADHEVQGRQRIEVACAVGDWGVHHAVGRAGGREAVRHLVGVDQLDADIAGEAAGAEPGVDVELEVAGEHILADAPALGGHIRIGIADLVVDAAADQAVDIIGDGPAEAEKLEVRALVVEEFARHADRDRAVGIALQAEEEFVGRQALHAAGVVEANLERAEQAAKIAFGAESEREQFVLDGPLVEIAVLAAGNEAVAPALRAGEADEAGVGVVQLRAEDGAAVAHQEADVVGCAQRAAAGAGVGLDVEVLAVDHRVAEVDGCTEHVVAGLDVPAGGKQVGVAVHDVVADHALHVVELARGHEATLDSGVGLQLGGRPEQRQLDAAAGLVVLEVRIEDVDRGRESLGRRPFEGAIDRIPGERSGRRIRLGAADDGCATGPAGGVTPGLEALDRDLLPQRARRDRDADGVVGELVDIGAREAVTPIAFFRVQPRRIDVIGAGVQRDGLLAVRERLYRAHVDRARQAGADQVARWRLVDIHLADHFGRELIIVDPAVVAGRHLFAAVQKRCRKVGRKAADREVLGPAAFALGCKTRQTRQRFCNRGVGKLADVDSRDAFADQVGILLGGDRACEAGAEAGDDDVLVGGCSSGRRILGKRRLGREQGKRACRRLQQQMAGCSGRTADRRHLHVILPSPWRTGTIKPRLSGASHPHIFIVDV